MGRALLAELEVTHRHWSVNPTVIGLTMLSSRVII